MLLDKKLSRIDYPSVHWDGVSDRGEMVSSGIYPYRLSGPASKFGDVSPASRPTAAGGSGGHGWPAEG